MGLASAGLVVAGLFGGRYLDTAWGTSPWFTLGLTVLGALVGQLTLVVIALRARRELVGPDQDEPDAQQIIRPIIRSVGLVAALVAATVAAISLGLWLDRALQTQLIFTLALPLLILVLAAALLVRSRQSQTETSDARAQPRETE